MARILDATAGNRTIWKTKEDERIIFIDIEAELQIPPDRIMNCVQTNFEGKQFHTIIFDPPHKVGDKKESSIFSTPHLTEKYKKWLPGRTIPVYYGSDKFESILELKQFLYKAGKEFHRILMDDGCLWFKWAENTFSLDEALDELEGFIIMVKFKTESNREKLPAHPAYWCLLMKNLNETIKRRELDEF